MDLPIIRNQLCLKPISVINGMAMFDGFPADHHFISFGMGCFWGAERLFWDLNGVYVTSVGYQGGTHIAPDYRLVCSGQTGHAEVVMVVYDPKQINLAELLKVFFENHDPTQGNRQGNDVGSQYRSAIYSYDDQQTDQANDILKAYDAAYQAKGFGPVTTQIEPAGTYFPAEDYHQQYLHKNPMGYCNHGPTGVSCTLAR